MSKRFQLERHLFTYPKERFTKKNIDNYIKKLFDLNKNIIIPGIQRTYQPDSEDYPKTEDQFYRAFYGELKNLGNDNITMQTIKRIERSNIIISQDEVRKENLIKRLKDQEKNSKMTTPDNLWEKFRSYNRHQQFNYDYLTYIGSKEGGELWEYNDPKRKTKIIIDITNSPEIILITRVEK